MIGTDKGKIVKKPKNIGIYRLFGIFAIRNFKCTSTILSFIKQEKSLTFSSPSLQPNELSVVFIVPDDLSTHLFSQYQLYQRILQIKVIEK